MGPEMDATRDELIKLVTHIEENLRASNNAGLDFVDSRQNQQRLLSKQNHVIFGRRGAGKTTLINSIKGSDSHIDVNLNLEDYKDITFPNIVVKILVELLNSLSEILDKKFPWWVLWRFDAKRVKDRVRKTIEELNQLLFEQDQELHQISTSESSEKQANVGATLKNTISDVSVGGGARANRTSEIKREVQQDKLGKLRLNITSYTKLISLVSGLLEEKPIFLILDDFYFLEKGIQPELIDYLHRLTKGTSLYLKLATINHRSKLYKRVDNQYIGVEIGHDIFEINQDYMLDDFDALQAFMLELLNKAIERSGTSIRVDQMFTENGLKQLCLASGGVPRDFLSLFVALANQSHVRPNRISKPNVTEAAIAIGDSKRASMTADSGRDSANLETCLRNILRFVHEQNHTNAFLIAKTDLESNSVGRQVIGELMDLRLIHLANRNTSKASSDKRFYEAYLIDLSLYSSAHLQNFKQIEPGETDEKSREDRLRGAPVLDVSILLDVSRPIELSKTTPHTQPKIKKGNSVQLGFDDLLLSYEP